MKLIIEMELDNAAIVDGGTEEVRRILDGLCDRLPEPLTETNGELSLHDANEDWVGKAVIQ